MNTPPLILVEFQKWMASLFDHPERGDQNGFKKQLIKHIQLHPKHDLEKRIQSYQQSVWNRQAQFLKRNLPFVFRFLGRQKFREEIVIPYFKKHPSMHWSLDEIFLDSHLSQWMHENYQREDRGALLELFELDFARKKASLAERINSSVFLDSIEGFSLRVFLQPHVHFLQISCSLQELTSGFVSEKRSKRKIYYVVFRNCYNKVVLEEIAEEQFFVLKAFEKGSSFEELGPAFTELRSWFFLCCQRGFFYCV